MHGAHRAEKINEATGWPTPVLTYRNEEVCCTDAGNRLYGIGGPSVLEPLSLPAPVCGEEQVRIRVEGVSVNYADLQTRRGSYHAGGTQFPVIPGLDAVGIVEAVGSRVDHIRVGQRVLAFPTPVRMPNMWWPTET